MIPLSQFHRDYLTMQGVILMPSSRVVSKPVHDREKEVVIKVNQYERDTL